MTTLPKKIAFLLGTLVLALLFIAFTPKKNTTAKENTNLGAQAADTKNTKETENKPLVIDFDSSTINFVKGSLTKDELKACISNASISEKITSESQFSEKKGTPLVYIASKDFTYEIQGALPYEYFKAIIESIKTKTEFTVPEEAVPYIHLIKDKEMLTVLSMAKSDHIAGNKAGEIGIIEYSDISCPFCKKVHPTITQIIKEDTSLFWIYRHHPLTSIHKLALEQAIATECVAQKKGDAVFFETLAKFMKETK